MVDQWLHRVVDIVCWPIQVGLVIAMLVGFQSGCWCMVFTRGMTQWVATQLAYSVDGLF